MKKVLVNGVSIFILKGNVIMESDGDVSEEFYGCKSEYFCYLRDCIYQIFKELDVDFLSEVDIEASVAFTMWDLFKDHDMNSDKLTWKVKPENIEHYEMRYGYLIRSEGDNSDNTYHDYYVRLSCTLWFIFKTDSDPDIGDLFYISIKNRIKDYEFNTRKQKKFSYYGFVSDVDVLKEKSRDEIDYQRTYAYPEAPTDCNEYDSKIMDIKRFCFTNEIDNAISRTYEEIKEIFHDEKPSGLLEVSDIEGFDEVFLKEIDDYIKNRFLKTASKSYPHIITFEGLAGCGRSTLAKRIADSCKSKSNGFRSQYLRDPVTGEFIKPPHYIEIDTKGMIPAYGDCVIFINHAEGYLDENLRNTFIAATKNCRERCLIILSASTGSIDELLNSSDTLRGLISKRFAFKNYTVQDEIDVLRWTLGKIHELWLNNDIDVRDSLKDLILTAARCPKENENQDEYSISVGGELANGYFAARLAEVMVSEFRKNKLKGYSIDNPFVNEVCEKLKAEFEKTGMVLSSQVVAEKDRSDKKLTFKDVVGNKTAIKELEKCLEWMKSEETGMRAVCLTGEPGCGKTFMARVVASMANAKFISKAGNDYIQNYSGQGAVALGELFDRVDGYKRCVLFIDEIDAIGKARDSDNADTLGSQALNKLLTRLDGFGTRKNKLILITATNCYDMLDPALKRRLGTRVDIRLPDREDRAAMLEHCLKTLPKEYTAEGFDDNAKMDLADEMAGMSFDRIQKVVTNVVDDLRSEENKTITKKLIYDRIYDELLGRRIENDTRDKATLERIAVHELGHTLVAMLSGRKVGYLTIAAREGGVGGYTKMMTTRQEGAPLTFDELKKEVRISLGGRAAEDIYYKGNVSNGCSGDISHVTDLLRNAVAKGGLGDTLTVRSADSPEVCEKAEEMCQELYKQTKEILISKVNDERFPGIIEGLVKAGSLALDDSYSWMHESKI